MITLPVASILSPIPKILHQVWVGSEPPVWVRASHERWREALGHGWRVELITDETVVDSMYEPTVRAAAALHPRGVADLLRVQAVAFHGGFYMDVDMVPLGDPLPTQLSGWVLSTPESETDNPSILCNGAFGFCAGHPFLSLVWEHAGRALSRGVLNEHFIAGPRAFRYAFERCPVTVDYSLRMWKGKAERRQQARGNRVDLSRCGLGSTWAVHVGTGGEVTL